MGNNWKVAAILVIIPEWKGWEPWICSLNFRRRSPHNQEDDKVPWAPWNAWGDNFPYTSEFFSDCLCGVSHFSTPCRAPQRPSRTTAMIHRVFTISLFSWLAEVRHHKPSFCLERLSKWNCHLGLCAASWWWPLQGLFVLLGCTFVVLDGCCAVIANVLESPLFISDDKTDSVSWTVPIQ